MIFDAAATYFPVATGGIPSSVLQIDQRPQMLATNARAIPALVIHGLAII
jgi:hypothetical protein